LGDFRIIWGGLLAFRFTAIIIVFITSEVRCVRITSEGALAITGTSFGEFEVSIFSPSVRTVTAFTL
jgi:hypothetical protein